MQFNTIVTHERPHLDEIVAIWLLNRFGEKEFPGISTAKLVFNRTAFEGRSAEDCERDGVLLLGIGGGRFDEHPTASGGRKERECAATLVAGALGVNKDKALRRILKFARNADLGGVNQAFDLADVIPLLHRQHPGNPEMAVEWATIALEAKYREQSDFWAAKEEFERNAKVEEIVGPGGRLLRVATFASDNERMNVFARSKEGGNAAIVIQQQPSGNVQIFTSKRFELTMNGVACMIRLYEQQASGRIVTTDLNALAAEGNVPGDDRWYFHHAGQMLLNGSLTARDIPPTRLSLEQIRRIVRIGINPTSFNEWARQVMPTKQPIRQRSTDQGV